MGSSMFDDIMAGAVVAKHLFRGASKAYAKAKQVAESEKCQQHKAELRAKTSEALDLAGEKAKEMGLEAKAKYVFDFAKEMVLNNSEPIPPDVQVMVYGPGGYAERISALEDQITEATAKHNQVLAELHEKLANAPESIEPGEYGFNVENIPVTANVYEDMIRDEERNFEADIYNLQEEIRRLKDELDEGLFMARQQCREEDAYEEELRREENARDWAIFLGQDPNEYR